MRVCCTYVFACECVHVKCVLAQLFLADMEWGSRVAAVAQASWSTCRALRRNAAYNCGR